MVYRDRRRRRKAWVWHGLDGDELERRLCGRFRPPANPGHPAAAAATRSSTKSKPNQLAGHEINPNRISGHCVMMIKTQPT